MPEGLYQKYAVRRLDGEWDSGSEYFVLDVCLDPHTRVALRAYAESVAPEKPELARDLADLLSRHG